MRGLRWHAALLLALVSLAGVVDAATATRPHFTGVWSKKFRDPANVAVPIPYNAEYLARYQRNIKLVEEGKLDLGGQCLPPGVPRLLDIIGQFEILDSPPGRLTILHEYETQVRRVFLDARHPEKTSRAVNGHSIARWEGNQLVIDTVAISDFVFLDGNAGPHGKSLRVIERLSLVDPETLKIEFTVEDPDALTQPWRYTRVYQRQKDSPLIDYECNENPRNPVNSDGSLGYSFKPPFE